MNSELKKHWAAWPLENWGITVLITTILLAFGFYGLVQMSKDEFPPFTIRMGVVVAVMPGATSEEIEAQVDGRWNATSSLSRRWTARRRPHRA